MSAQPGAIAQPFDFAQDVIHTKQRGLWNQAWHRLLRNRLAVVAGAILLLITTVALLADFVPETTDWLHLDLFAWNDTPRPGRPVGGEAQTLRTLLAYLEQRYGGG